MATPRSSQTHQKSVQQIASDAAEKIAADAPLEEEVVVVVEELPPGESARTQRGRTPMAPQPEASPMLGLVAQTQNVMASGIDRWIELTAAPFRTRMEGRQALSGPLDLRHLVQQTFRLAEEVIASQKEFALKLAVAITPARTS